MTTLPNPFIALVDGKFVRVDSSITNLGTQDDMIKKVAAEMPTNLLNAFVLPGGKMANIQVLGASIICWTEMTEININTVYTVGSNGDRWPLFKNRPETSPPEHLASFAWQPKFAGMRMFFATTMKLESGLYRQMNSWLISKAPKRKEIFRPPLPNIHGDSRMCMGSDYAHAGPCLADEFSYAVNHFNSSKWNSDAMEGLTIDHIKNMFSFDKDGKQLQPPKDYKWWEHPCSHSVNNANYGELPIV